MGCFGSKENLAEVEFLCRTHKTVVRKSGLPPSKDSISELGRNVNKGKIQVWDLFTLSL